MSQIITETIAWTQNIKLSQQSTSLCPPPFLRTRNALPKDCNLYYHQIQFIKTEIWMRTADPRGSVLRWKWDLAGLGRGASGRTQGARAGLWDRRLGYQRSTGCGGGHPSFQVLVLPPHSSNATQNAWQFIACPVQSHSPSIHDTTKQPLLN